MIPAIQSAYCCRVFTSASGSACAENVASGLQKVLQASQPLPASQASKNCFATVVIESIESSLMPALWRLGMCRLTQHRIPPLHRLLHDHLSDPARRWRKVPRENSILQAIH